LIPHVVIFVMIEVHYGIFERWYSSGLALSYAIVVIGLPFLLYCFLQVTCRLYVILAIILCFISMFFTFFGYALIIGVQQ
jgi:hypothetical protein